MSMLRGDNDIMSLMDVMASNQGYETKNSRSQDVAEDQLVDGDHERVRLAPEVPGYSEDNKVTSEFPEYGNGKEYIWNPFVNVKMDSRSTYKIPIPTNPEVEVHRRRSYEKFKKKFYTIFTFIAENAKKNQGSNEDISDELLSFWTKLPTHSIWERFHFICKLEENLMAAQNIRTQGHFEYNSTSTDIEYALAAILKAKTDGTMVDPILISSSNGVAAKGSTGEKKHSRVQLPPLLQNEIVFQWKREWRRLKGNDYNRNEELNEELEKFFLTKKFKRTINKIVRDIDALAGEIEHEFIKALQKRASVMSTSQGRKSKSNKRIPRLSFLNLEKSDEDNNTSVSVLEYSGLSLRINDTHLEKLRILFDRNNQNSNSLASHEAAFNSALFVLLARYDMLEGAGLQSSLNENVFDILLRKFDCKTECFASPFNCRYERYCSAFPDTDIAFGSLGSFFDFDFKGLKNGGCFQANPPFVADFIVRMYKRMEELLMDDEDIESSPLMFIVFIPAWKETNGWNVLNTSSLLSNHVLLSQKADPHYYCEGTQHRRSKARYRIASFDTSVFFLQNKLAKMKWPVTKDIIEELKTAFSINPEETMSKFIQKTKAESVPPTNQLAKNVSCKTTKDEEVAVKHQNHTTKMTQKNRHPKPSNKQSQKKKKLVEDSGTMQLDILASLGIISDKSSEKHKNDGKGGKQQKTAKNSRIKDDMKSNKRSKKRKR